MARDSSGLTALASLVTALVGAGPSALGGGVGNVSHSPIVVHADLQAAIDAAADGDVLLVHGGSYTGFTIDNRSIAIFAVPGEAVTVQGRVEIRNVPSTKRVVLSDLEVHETIPSGYDGTRAVYVTSCSGSVWIQSCTLVGADGVDTSSFPDGGFGGAGLEVSNAANVVVVGSQLFGGYGGDIQTTSCFPACWLPGEGGSGLWVRPGSRVALYDCDLVGGHGGNGGYQSAVGGNGIFVSPGSGPLLISNSSASGGNGGDCVAWQNGDGGDGLRNGAGAGGVYSLGNLFVGGTAGQGPASNPGTNGVPVWGTSTSLAANPRRFATAHVARDATPIQAELFGDVGDAFFAPNSATAAWLLKLAANGVWTLRYPAYMPTTPLAVLTSPVAIANWTTPQVPSGQQAALRFSQGYALPQAGGAVLASPACTLLLDVDALPDCDGNGVFDVIDIVEGAPDFNVNFVSDACAVAKTWYVDDSAAPGGDGSLAAPFQTLQAGIGAAASADTVVVLDGNYVGAANRNVDFGGKTLIVKSLSGPANCVIDCQGLGRAFDLHLGEGAATRIDGFTIRNGWIAGLGGVGGAIRLDGSSFATISACSFESNGCGGIGGAIGVDAGARVDVETCAFISNHAVAWGGALSLRAASDVVRIRDCSFDGCDADSGGAILCFDSDAQILRSTFRSNQAAQTGGAIGLLGYGTCYLTHSTFLANVASDRGGAVHCENSSATQMLSLTGSNLLFAGNQAHGNGGGAISAFGSPTLTVAITLGHSTLVSNTADWGPGGGGALRLANASSELYDTILWQNFHPSNGAQARLDNGSLTIDACDVDGGQAGIANGGGALNWGGGNLTLDPKFTDPDGPDNDPATFGDNVYRLTLLSPCLDAGNTTYAIGDVTDIDGDGNFGEAVPLDLNLKPRFMDLVGVPDTGVGFPPIDLGCYERQN